MNKLGLDMNKLGLDMNKLWVALIGVALLGGALAQVEQMETKALEMNGVSSLEVKTFNGSIKVVVGQEQPSVRISQRGQVSYSINQAGNTLVLEGKKQTTVCDNCAVGFELRLPMGLMMQLLTSNSAIEVKGSVNGLEASTSNGYILTQNTGNANLTLRTSNGRVSVHDATGQIRVNTSNGQVLLERVNFVAGSDNWAKTSNAAITVNSMTASGGMEVRGRTSNGRVSFIGQGFSVNFERNSFMARREGDMLVRLELEASNGAISVN